jgi:hypothetical protein
LQLKRFFVSSVKFRTASRLEDGTVSFVHPSHSLDCMFVNRVSLPKSTWFVAYKQLILRCLVKLGMVSEDDDDELKLLIVQSQIDCACY